MDVPLSGRANSDGSRGPKASSAWLRRSAPLSICCRCPSLSSSPSARNARTEGPPCARPPSALAAEAPATPSRLRSSGVRPCRSRRGTGSEAPLREEGDIPDFPAQLLGDATASSWDFLPPRSTPTAPPRDGDGTSSGAGRRRWCCLSRSWRLRSTGVASAGSLHVPRFARTCHKSTKTTREGARVNCYSKLR